MTLPSHVTCGCGCARTVSTDNARRELVAWVRPGQGGSFSNPLNQHFTGRWMANGCIHAGCVPDEPCRMVPFPTEREEATA